MTMRTKSKFNLDLIEVVSDMDEFIKKKSR